MPGNVPSALPVDASARLVHDAFMLGVEADIQ
jgi:hypothetical protein